MGSSRNPALAFCAGDDGRHVQDLLDQLRRACMMAGIRPPKHAPVRAARHVSVAACGPDPLEY